MTKQASEPVTTGLVEWSDCEFKATMINMLRGIRNKIDNMQKQI